MMFPQWSEFAVSGSANSIVRRGGKTEGFGVRRLAAALRFTIRRKSKTGPPPFLRQGEQKVVATQERETQEGGASCRTYNSDHFGSLE
jgi:hypothetical protein